MADESLKKLKELLGEEWTDEELNEVLREFPDLPKNAPALAQALQRLAQEPLPNLSFDFTEKIMASLTTMGRVKARVRRWWSLKGLSYAVGGVMVLLLGFYFVPRWWSGPLEPGLQVVREEDGPGQGKSYVVRFAVQKPGAQSVALMGDFNQWRGTRLKKTSEGIFYAEMKLPQGTYAYGFLVDGKEWVPDTTAPRMIPDGFGRQNSLVNL